MVLYGLAVGADGVLFPDDVIVEIDGEVIAFRSDVIDFLEPFEVGDEIVRERVDRSGPGVDPINPVWVSVDGIDPEGEFFASIVDERITEAIDGLPAEYRTAVLLSDVEGLSYAEIAELLEVPVGTVKSRLFRGRRQLQKVLYDYAVEMGYVTASAGAESS